MNNSSWVCWYRTLPEFRFLLGAVAGDKRVTVVTDGRIDTLAVSWAHLVWSDGSSGVIYWNLDKGEVSYKDEDVSHLLKEFEQWTTPPANNL